MQHQGDVLAAFQDGETRLIYARPRASGPLWLLPDGEARLHRARTKAELACPVLSCPEPELTTVARFPKKRDGFRHLSGGRHAPESLFHLQGKERIADWLRTNYPRSSVKVEQQSDTNRTRVADVMITAPSGDRIAFEIQYSPITREKWRERHDSYLDQGILDVWLWGHYGANLKADRHSPGFVRLTPAQRLVAELGLPLFWFNPVLAQIGAAGEMQYAGSSAVETLPERGSGRFRAEPLDEFNLNGGEFGSEQTRQLLADTRRYRLVKAEREARARAREERERARRQAEAEQKAAAERKRQAEAKAHAARIAESTRRAEAAWLASAERADRLARFGGTWPDWLNVEVEHRLAVPAEQWQSAIYLRFFLDLSHGNRITRDPIVTWLQHEYRIPAESREAATRSLFQWLNGLAKLGIVRRRDSGPRYRRQTSFYVVDPAYLDPTRRLASVESLISRRPEVQHSLDRRREEIEARPPLPAPERESTEQWEARVRAAREAALNDPPSPGFGKAVGRCAICGFPLDPIYANTGHHAMCGRMRS